MYTFGDNDEFSLRGSLSFFDGSALVDEETDTLIYPGENGILYLIHLNTQYDPEAGARVHLPGSDCKMAILRNQIQHRVFLAGNGRQCSNL